MMKKAGLTVVPAGPTLMTAALTPRPTPLTPSQSGSSALQRNKRLTLAALRAQLLNSCSMSTSSPKPASALRPAALLDGAAFRDELPGRVDAKAANEAEKARRAASEQVKGALDDLLVAGHRLLPGRSRAPEKAPR